MCMEDEVKITQQQLDGFVSACTTMITIQKNYELIQQKNEMLEKRIDEEIQERKDDIKEMQKENRDQFDQIRNKFEVLFTSIGKIHTRIDHGLEKMNKHIRNGMKAIIIITLFGFASFYVTKLLGWF